MAAEASKMLEELREITEERDRLSFELSTRNAANESLRAEKSNMLATLSDTQGINAYLGLIFQCYILLNVIRSPRD